MAKCKKKSEESSLVMQARGTLLAALGCFERFQIQACRLHAAAWAQPPLGWSTSEFYYAELTLREV